MTGKQLRAKRILVGFCCIQFISLSMGFWNPACVLFKMRLEIISMALSCLSLGDTKSEADVKTYIAAAKPIGYILGETLAKLMKSLPTIDLDLLNYYSK